MATQWPVVHGRLVNLVRSLWPDVEVYGEPPVTSDTPRTYCTVGYALGEDSGGGYSTTKAGSGWQVEETGRIRCELVAVTGEADLATVRLRAFARMDELEEAIRADQTLGVMPQGATAELEVDVVSVQTESGAKQRLPFTVNYFIRT